MSSETIVALATPQGEGAIAIVRLSGSDALDIALKITKRSDLTPRYAHLTTLYDTSNNAIDQAITIYFKAPNSYTGEDLIEFQLHGGSISTELVLKTALNYGARVARSGEFTIRAVHNDKMDIAQAEAVVAMIGAKSAKAATLLTRQIKGGLKEFVEEIRSKLIRSRAYIEVAIDYAEEDIPSNIIDQIVLDLIGLQNLLDHTVRASEARSGLLLGYKVAIIGKPNVGKSSLLNRLVNYERAIVSSVAGTTRDTVEEQFFIAGTAIKLVDTAGMRDTHDEIEKIGIERSRQAAGESDLIVAVFDSSSKATDEDLAILDLIRSSDKEHIVVLNKSDLEQQIDLSIFSGLDLIRVCAKSDIEELIKRLEKSVASDDASEENLLVSARQIEVVRLTQKEIQSAHNSLLQGDLELFSYHCFEAIKQIEMLTKPFVYDELLDVMFGEFCLGK